MKLLQILNEKKSLGKKVTIVKGEHKGKSGVIREIHNGPYKGADKSYYIDLDDGKQANNLPGSAFRLVKKIDEMYLLAGITEASNNKVSEKEFKDAMYNVYKKALGEKLPDYIHDIVDRAWKQVNKSKVNETANTKLVERSDEDYKAAVQKAADALVYAYDEVFHQDGDQ